jgi:hypothetical protein
MCVLARGIEDTLLVPVNSLHRADACERYRAVAFGGRSDAMRRGLHLTHVVLGRRDRVGEVGNRLL